MKSTVCDDCTPGAVTAFLIECNQLLIQLVLAIEAAAVHGKRPLSRLLVFRGTPGLKFSLDRVCLADPELINERPSSLIDQVVNELGSRDVVVALFFLDSRVIGGDASDDGVYTLVHLAGIDDASAASDGRVQGVTIRIDRSVRMLTEVEQAQVLRRLDLLHESHPSQPRQDRHDRHASDRAWDRALGRRGLSATAESDLRGVGTPGAIDCGPREVHRSVVESHVSALLEENTSLMLARLLSGRPGSSR